MERRLVGSRIVIAYAGLFVLGTLSLSLNASGQEIKLGLPLSTTTEPESSHPGTQRRLSEPAAGPADLQQSQLKELRDDVRALREEVRQLIKLLHAQAATPNPVLPNPVLPNPVLPNSVLPNPTLPNPTLPNPTLPNPTLPKPTLPKPNPSLPTPTLPKPTRVLPHPTLAPDAENVSNRSVLMIQLRNISAKDARAAVERLKSPSGQLVTLEITNELIVLDDPEHLQRVLDQVRQLDRTPEQIRIVVHAFELSTATMDKLRRDTSSPLSELGAGNSMKAFDNVAATIKSLMEQRDVTVITRPQVITVNGQQACIQVGQEIPIPQVTSTPDGTAANPTAIRTADFSLKVKPLILEDGTMELDVEQEISRVAGYSTSANVPILNRRRANFSVRLRSAQTIVLNFAGNYGNDEPQASPTSDVPSKPEYLIFITPEIVGREVAKDQTFQFFMGFTR